MPVRTNLTGVKPPSRMRPAFIKPGLWRWNADVLGQKGILKELCRQWEEGEKPFGFFEPADPTPAQLVDLTLRSEYHPNEWKELFKETECGSRLVIVSQTSLGWDVQSREANGFGTKLARAMNAYVIEHGLTVIVTVERTDQRTRNVRATKGNAWIAELMFGKLTYLDWMATLGIEDQDGRHEDFHAVRDGRCLVVKGNRDVAEQIKSHWERGERVKRHIAQEVGVAERTVGRIITKLREQGEIK
jgi:hypothetical protein